MSKQGPAGKRSSESSSHRDDEINHDPSGKKKQRIDEKIEPSDAFQSTQAATISCQTPTVYVSNLHNRIAEPHLQKLFQRFGEINRVNLIRRMGSGTSVEPMSESGPSRPQKGSIKPAQQQDQHHGGFSYAFVEFKSVQSACTAIEKLKGVALLGRDLVVRPAHEKSDGSGGISGSETHGGDIRGSKLSMQSVRKQKSEVENKIDALRKALNGKQS